MPSASSGSALAQDQFAPRNATTCMPHDLPLWLAVALTAPVAVATRSSVILPNAMSRAVNPEPADVTILSETPAPKIRSLALVVVTLPLFNTEDDPVADLVTST